MPPPPELLRPLLWGSGSKPLNVNVAELLNEIRDERDNEILANLFPPHS